VIVVSNSSCLIGLSRIKMLNLLKELFGKIFISQEVYKDVVLKGKGRPGAKEVEKAKGEWIEVRGVKGKLAVEVLLTELDPGEAETIILASEINASLVIIDEEKGASVATITGLKVIGTVGILILANKIGKLDSLKGALDQLKKNKFRISDEVYQMVLRKGRAGKDERES
jgi:uncharacterized protein